MGGFIVKNVGDYIVYQKDVCKIVDRKENAFSHLDCYSLIPVRDESLKLSVPVTNPNIRDLMSQEDIENLIVEIPSIPLIDLDDKQLENEYKRLLSLGTPKDLIQIIRTTYMRNQKRIEHNKKTSDKDSRYFELAETYLYYEIAAVMGMSFEEAKEYVFQKVHNEIS